MSLVPALVGVIAGLAVFLVVAGASTRRRAPVDLLDARLAVYDQPEAAGKTLQEIELSRPFAERVIRPWLDRMGKRVANLQPKDQAQKLQVMIDLAGRPFGLNASSLVAVQIALAVLLALALMGVAILLDLPVLLGLVAGAVAGYLGPSFFLKRTYKARQHEIMLALPNSLDLLCISVEAGLGFDAALTRVVEKFDNALSREFALVLNEVRVGRPRTEALEEMGRRSGVRELNTFIQALVQSEQLGVGIARVLRIQSDELRRHRRQKAEAKAQQASLKMLFPMVGCIFPCLFIVLLGPAFINLVFLHAG